MFFSMYRPPALLRPVGRRLDRFTPTQRTPISVRLKYHSNPVTSRSKPAKMNASAPQSVPKSPTQRSAVPVKPLEISIGPALESHAPAISAIGCKTYTETFGHDIPITDLESFLEEDYSVEAVKAWLKDSEKATFVARAGNGDVVGFIQMVRGKTEPSVRGTAEELAMFQKLYIDVAEQGKGAGGKLLTFVEELARKEGFKRMWMTVWDENYKAQQMYERRGYQRTGGEIDFATGKTIQTDWVYSKDL